MTKIKIKSNPYEKKLSYYLYEDSEWKDIVKDDSKYSGKLISDKLQNGFFPFIVEEVINTIIDEYKVDEKISLFFEGTTDEYKAVASICENPAIAKCIKLQPGERYLNNAYDVLPHIVEIFGQKIRPIVKKSISDDSEIRDSVESDLAKFTDASDEIIPICVIGNYSAGKSTFINALIGLEILPSGDKAVTAHLCKIYQSKEDASADISFVYAGAPVCLHVTEDSYSIDVALGSNPVTELLENKLSQIPDKGLVPFVNTALSVINNYKTDDECNGIGDIIEVHIPFNKGHWGDFAGKFVILDTPGSNAASHTDHKAVLEKAMKGMSNGIPMYVAEPFGLDSDDNIKLYDLVKQVEGIDPRFTMIIVNKADTANLPEESFSEQEKDGIINQAIPRSLSCSDIYYVSSIIGLGAKTEGEFIDRHLLRTFEQNRSSYSDENNRWYRQLYKYNIMPAQIKAVEEKAAEKMAETDKLYVNSGLFSVERGLDKFAAKYSSYNKCQQANYFLRKIVDATEKEIQTLTDKREKEKQAMEEKLEQDRLEMIASVEESASLELENYMSSYEGRMASTLESSKKSFSVQEFKNAEEQFTREQKRNLDIEFLQTDAKKQIADVGEAFRTGFHKLGTSFKLSTIKEVGASVVKEAKEAVDSNAVLFTTQRVADRGASDDLIKQTNIVFYNQANKADSDIDSTARQYWIDCSMSFRDMLADVVKNTTLSEKKKHEITELITGYRKIEFDIVENENVFRVDEFDYLLSVGNFKLFKMDKLFLNRLSHAYKVRISEIVDKIARNIYEVYLNSFTVWEENLVNVVRANIVDYSPELRKQQMEIDEKTRKIHDLQNMQNRLQIYSEDIQSMIEWKEV